MHAGRALTLVALIAATGCMHAARVFLDIPEGGPEQPQQLELTEEIRALLAPPIPQPAAIEAVQSPDSVLGLLPDLPGGGVDWVVAWETDVIRPRAGVRPVEPDSTGEFSYDLYLSTGEGPEAYFPHSTHRAWMSCESCHPGVYRNGGDSFSRESAHEQDSCGKCHGVVAFQIQACEQCHESATGLPRARTEKSLGGVIRMTRLDAGTGAGRIGQGYDLVGAYPPARFPHGAHRLRYQCRACHERPFAMTSGATVLSQEDAHSGRGCGMCHNGIAAFGADLDSCSQCHVSDGG